MERISIVDTTSGIILYDHIYGHWKPDQQSPPHSATLINLFVLFSKNINAGAIQSVTFSADTVQQQQQQQSQPLTTRPSDSTNTSLPPPIKPRHKSPPHTVTLHLLIKANVTVAIYVNTSAYTLNINKTLSLLYDAFIQQYNTTLTSIRTALDTHLKHRTDDMLQNVEYVHMFAGYEEVVPQLGVLMSSSAVTSPAPPPPPHSITNTATLHKADGLLHSTDTPGTNHSSHQLTTRSRANTHEVDDVRLSSSAMQQQRLLRQSAHFTDLEELNLDLQSDYNDVSTTMPERVEQSVTSSALYQNTVNSKMMFTGSMMSKPYYREVE